MVRQALILGCAAAALAGCGKIESEGDPEITVRSEQQDQLFELSPLYRNIALKRAITASNMPCQRVEYSGFVGQYDNLDQWTAMCDDGRQWAIFIGPDDYAQVRYCDDVVETGLPACEITRMDTRDEQVVEDTADG